jgi:hypothetical protein
MNTRLTLDFGDPKLVQMVKWEAVKSGGSMKDVIVKALEAYFTAELEYQAMLNGASQSFAAWDNKKDAVYDQL